MTAAVILVCIITIFLPSIVIALKIKYEEKRNEKDKLKDIGKIKSKLESIDVSKISINKKKLSPIDIPVIEKTVELEDIKTSEEKSDEFVSITTPIQKEKKKRGRKPGKKNKTTSKPRKKGGDQLLLS
jgi:hypothetical protein